MHAESNEKSSTELNSRLEEILAQHRGKEERLLNLEQAKKDLEDKYNADLQEKEQQHAKRVNILQQQIKMVESRNESLQQRISTLQKERDDALENGLQKTKRIEELINEVDVLEKNIIDKQAQIREKESKIKILDHNLKQEKGKSEVYEKKIVNLEAENTKQAQEIVISRELQEHLNKLLTQKDQRIQALNGELKKFREQQNTLSENLRNQFQEELNKHTRIHETKHEEEIKKIQNSLKQENKKTLCKYRESLAEKNHGIENLKETANRLKQINKNLKLEKEKMEKANNQWENQTKILKSQIENLKEKHEQTLKQKKNLLQDMRSKYLEKSSELGELKLKYNEVTKEVQTYRNFVMEEEKALGYIPEKKNRNSKSLSMSSLPRQVEDYRLSRNSKDSFHNVTDIGLSGTTLQANPKVFESNFVSKVQLKRSNQSYSSIQAKDEERVRKKRKLSHDFNKPKDNDNTQFLESALIFDLCAVDLIKGELAIQCCSPKVASLEGWQLTNANHTKIFDFPSILIQPGEKKKIHIGVDCVADSEAIHWNENIWDGKSNDAIQLIDSEKNVRALIPLTPEFVSSSNDASCMIM